MIYATANPADLTTKRPGTYLFGPTGDGIPSGLYSTTAVTGSPVGPYPIIVADSVTSDLGQTYRIVGVDSTLTVEPAELTFTADPRSRIYGDRNPSLTGSYSGFARGEGEGGLTTSADLSTTAVTDSPIGN